MDFDLEASISVLAGHEDSMLVWALWSLQFGLVLDLGPENLLAVWKAWSRFSSPAGVAVHLRVLRTAHRDVAQAGRRGTCLHRVRRLPAAAGRNLRWPRASGGRGRVDRDRGGADDGRGLVRVHGAVHRPRRRVAGRHSRQRHLDPPRRQQYVAYSYMYMHASADG